MPKMRLSDLIRQFPVTETIGAGDPMISGLVYDSRRVKPGYLFFALPGIHADGLTFVDAAIQNGAVAVIAEHKPARPADVPLVLVHNVRQAMSGLSARFFGHPSRQIPVIGVTGTDGKTSVVYFMDQLLGRLGEESAFLSTALVKTDLRVEPNRFRQSTPEAPEIQAALFEMVENGRSFAIVEATSHGLSEKTSRLKDVEFRAGVFTNLSPEHLDFHGTMDQYRSDKANLFRGLERAGRGAAAPEIPSFGVVCADDEHAYYFRSITRVPVYSYSVSGGEADLAATDIKADSRGSECRIRWRKESRRIRIPLPGSFNVENVLAAVLTVARLLDKNPLDLLENVPYIQPVPGRMELVRDDLPYTPIVDYAHTPGAYAKVLPDIRNTTEGRLIVLFGSAGERDTEKRSELGRLAARYADVIVLADEDPRGEQPLAVLEQIASGCLQERPSLAHGTDLLIVPPRREAIERTLRLAEPGDTLFFLGKGHEKTIEYADHVQAWHEVEEVAAAIERIQQEGAE